jgi:hypothetical protein
LAAGSEAKHQEDRMTTIGYIGLDIHKKPNYGQLVTPLMKIGAMVG